MPDKDTHLPTHYTIDQAEDEIGDIRGEHDLLAEAHAQTDSTDVPDTPTTGHIMFATAGHMRYASGVTGDSNYYATGRNTNVASNSLNFTTSMQDVPGLGIALGVGTYRIVGLVLINNPGTAGQGTLQYRVHGTGGLTCSGGRILFRELHATGGVNGDFTTTPPLDVTVTGSSPGTGGEDLSCHIDGIVVVTVAGTITVQMKQNTTAACNSVQFGTYVQSEPVV